MERVKNILMRSSLILIVLFCFTSFVFSQTWESTSGPVQPQGVKDLSIVKISGTEYLWALSDTAKYSTNGGSTWNVSSYTVLNPTVIEASPSLAGFAVTAKPGNIYRTFNYGGTWSGELTDGDLVPYRLAVNPSDDNYWLLGTDTVAGFEKSSVRLSVNRGDVWVNVSYFSTTAHPNANDVIYCPNGDTAWVGGSSKPLAFTPDMTDETSTGTKTKGVWYSSNKGVSWSFRGGFGSGTDRNVSALAYSNKAQTLLFAVTTKDVSGTRKAILYQSADHGQSWSQRADLYSDSSMHIGLVYSLMANPAKPETLIAATDKGFAMSTNRGVAWSLKNTGIVDVTNLHRVGMQKENSNIIYIASDICLYKSTDNGTNWTADQSPNEIMYSNAVAATGGMIQAVSSQYPGVALFSSGAWDNSPTIIAGGDFTGECAVIHSSFDDYSIAGGDSASYAVIYQSNDAGVTWQKRYTSSSSAGVIKTVVPDMKKGRTRMYAGGLWTSSGTKNFIKSTDTGKTWTGAVNIASSSAPVLCLAVDSTGSHVYSDTLYAGLGSTLGAYKSTDNGSTWPGGLAKLSGNNIQSIILNPAVHNTLYFSSDSYVWKSTDGMTNVSLLSTGFGGARKLLMHPSYPTLADFVWAISADSQKIYGTTNGGSSWSEVDTDTLPKPILDLSAGLSYDPSVRDTIHIFAATGGGVYMIDPDPAIPSGYQLTGSNCNPCAEAPGPCYAKVQWNANKECDFAHVSIERSIDGTGDPVEVQQSGGTSWTDLSVTLSCAGTNWVYYRIRAKDAAGNYSDYTDWQRVKGTASSPKTVVRNDAFDKENQVYEYRLHQNSPNPFNPMTVITYSLAENGPVTIKLYDIIGREMSTLVDEIQSAGIKSIQFDGGDLPSGVYLYRMVAGTFTDLKKLLLVK